MKLEFVGSLLVVSLMTPLAVWSADEAKAPVAVETPAKESKLKTDLAALIQKVQRKSGVGPVTEEALKEEIAAFDQLLSTHKDAPVDERAIVLVYKATLYLQILQNAEKAVATLNRVKEEFPQAKQIPQVDQMIDAIAKQQAAAKIQSGLSVGTMFPDFEEKDLEGNTVSIKRLKGNVVWVNFWASWNPPSAQDLTHLLDLYRKYHGRGWEVVGVSLDRDEAALKAFLKQNKITWPQIFDGKVWETDVAKSYGVTSLPFSVLIDGDGRIIAKNPTLDQLEQILGRTLGQ